MEAQVTRRMGTCPTRAIRRRGAAVVLVAIMASLLMRPIGALASTPDRKTCQSSPDRKTAQPSPDRKTDPSLVAGSRAIRMPTSM